MAEEDPLWYQLLKDSVVMDEEREWSVDIFSKFIPQSHRKHFGAFMFETTISVSGFHKPSLASLGMAVSASFEIFLLSVVNSCSGLKSNYSHQPGLPLIYFYLGLSGQI